MAETTETPRRRWLHWVLIGSLALNLAVLGLAAGVMLRLGGWGEGAPPRALGPALYRELPREDRRALRSALRAVRAEAVAVPRAMGADLAAALRADPFDPDPVTALIERQGAARATFQAALQRHWLERVAAMPPAARAAYADRLEAALARGRSGDGPSRD